MRIREIGSALVLLIFMSHINAYSQSAISSIFWMNATGYFTLGGPTVYSQTYHQYFGNHISATRCLDSLSPTMVEKLCPPDYSVEWGDSCGWMLSYDIRNIPTNSSVADTFSLVVGDVLGPHIFEWILTWPDSNYLRARCDSMFLVDVYGGAGKINMFNLDSLAISYPDTITFDKFRILKYGVHLVDAVQTESHLAPKNFSLKQNYPNPFNPETNIFYFVPKQSHVSLRVYDNLGREVARLVEQMKTHGEYSVTWNAVSLPGGIYYYRLVAGSYVETKKMVLMR